MQRYKDGGAAVAGPAVASRRHRYAEMMRINIDDLREGKLSANLLLQDGDMIIVPPAERFYVDGFVKTPGPSCCARHDRPPGDRGSGRHERARIPAASRSSARIQGRTRDRNRRQDGGSRSPERHHHVRQRLI